MGNGLKVKVITIILLILTVIILALTRSLWVRSNNGYTDYRLVVYINNKLYALTVVRVNATIQESSYLTYIYAKSKCLMFNASMFNVTDGELCIPYSLTTDVSYPPSVSLGFSTIAFQYAADAEVLVYRILVNIPSVRRFTDNGYLRFAEMHYNGGPILQSIINNTQGASKYIYGIVDLTYDFSYVAYGKNGTLVGLVKASIGVDGDEIVLNVTLTPKSKLIVSVPFETRANYSLSIVIRVNGGIYADYAYNISNPVIEYLGESRSVTWGCFNVELPMFNISYSDVCLPLGMSIKMPSYFWFSNEPMGTLMPHVREASGLVLKILNAIPVVRRYINNNLLVMDSEGFQISWVKEGPIAVYSSIGAIYYKWIFTVYANGVRVGLIYVTMYATRSGTAYYVDIGIRLITRNEIEELNRVRLQGLVTASEINSTWSGYVASYDSGYSEYGNDTFEAITAWITVPEFSLNPSCISNQALAAWVGLSPGNQWYTPYVQAGWIWMEQVSQEYSSYQLFYADEPQGDLITPVSLSGYYVEQYSTITVNIQYGHTASSNQTWYINWYVGYPNGTYVEVTYNETYPLTIGAEADNWQAAQFAVETPLINGEYACLPSLGGGVLMFYSDYVYDTVNPTPQLVGNGTWLGLTQFISHELQGVAYLYNLTLSNVGGYAQPTGISQCTVPSGYYNAGYVSENCFQVELSS